MTKNSISTLKNSLNELKQLFYKELLEITSESSAVIGSYSLLNRFLLLRIFEDNSKTKIITTKMLKFLDDTKDHKTVDHWLISIFNNMNASFDQIYKTPLFGEIYLSQIHLPKSTIRSVFTELNNFDFSQIDIDIIGHLYEESVSRDIRNSLGQFYTEKPIIHYIIKNILLGANITNYNEFIQKTDLTIIDPACGSGRFLVNFYEILKEKLDPNGRNEQFVHQKLVSILYGIDIDQFAVQISKMNLFLRQKSLISQNLSNQIFYNDAVCKPLVNKKKYTFIVGNPPFYEIKRSKDIEQLYPMINSKKPNIVSLFLARYLQLLVNDGILSFVLPGSIIFSDAYLDIRKYILENFSILEITLLGRAFSNVGLEQIIISIQNKIPIKNHKVKIVYAINDLENRNYKEFLVFQNEFKADQKSRFRVFNDEIAIDVIRKIEDNSINLKKIVKTYKAGSQEILAISRGMGWEKHTKRKKQKDFNTECIKGTSIVRFGLKKGYFVKDQILLKSKSEKVKILLEKEKIVLQCIVSSRTRLVAAVDYRKMITLSTVENIVLKDNSKFNPKFLVAILNSDLISYYVIDHIFMHSRLTTKLDKEYAGLLPIPKISKIDQTEIVVIVTNIENYVQNSIELGKHINEIENSNRYKSLNKSLNEAIYNLYDLNKKEINIIQERLTKFYLGDKK